MPSSDGRLRSLLGGLEALHSSLLCGICLEPLQRPARTRCGHTFCRFCIERALESSGHRARCPSCNSPGLTKRALEDDKRGAAISAALANVRTLLELDTAGALPAEEATFKPEAFVPVSGNKERHDEQEAAVIKKRVPFVLRGATRSEAIVRESNKKNFVRTSNVAFVQLGLLSLRRHRKILSSEFPHFSRVLSRQRMCSDVGVQADLSASPDILDDSVFMRDDSGRKDKKKGRKRRVSKEMIINVALKKNLAEKQLSGNHSSAISGRQSRGKLATKVFGDELTPSEVEANANLTFGTNTDSHEMISQEKQQHHQLEGSQKSVQILPPVSSSDCREIVRDDGQTMQSDDEQKYSDAFDQLLAARGRRIRRPSFSSSEESYPEEKVPRSKKRVRPPFSDISMPAKLKRSHLVTALATTAEPEPSATEGLSERNQVRGDEFSTNNVNSPPTWPAAGGGCRKLRAIENINAEKHCFRLDGDEKSEESSKKESTPPSSLKDQPQDNGQQELGGNDPKSGVSHLSSNVSTEDSENEVPTAELKDKLMQLERFVAMDKPAATNVAVVAGHAAESFSESLLGPSEAIVPPARRRLRRQPPLPDKVAQSKDNDADDNEDEDDEDDMFDSTPQKMQMTTRSKHVVKDKNPPKDLTPSLTEEKDENAASSQVLQSTTMLNTADLRSLVLLCTGLCNSDKELFGRFVELIGCSSKVVMDEDVTHVVVGEEGGHDDLRAERTLKYLQAVALGKRVIGVSWIKECIEKKSIFSPDAFEALDNSGADGPRRSRLALKEGSKKVFQGFKFCLEGTFKSISKEQITQLLSWSGGTILKCPAHFSHDDSSSRLVIVDGDGRKDVDAKQISEKFKVAVADKDWVIESLGAYEIKSVFPFLLHPASRELLKDLGCLDEALVRSQDSVF